MPDSRSDSSFEYLVKELEHISKSISPEDEKEYIERAQSGDKEALEKLMISVLPQVFEMAKYFANLFQLKSDIIPDLVNEGNRGVLLAIKKFDFSKSNRLFSYAWYWAKDYMLKFIKNYLGEIKIPESAIKKLRKIRQEEEEYIRQHKRHPSDSELAQLVGLTEQEIRTLKAIPTSSVSIDTAFGTDEEDRKETWMDISEQNALPSPEKYYAEIKLNQLVKEIFSFLSKKEGEIIKLYFGFEDGKKHTLEDIGQRLGITKQRVQQLRDRALKRIKERYGNRILTIFQELYQED